MAEVELPDGFARWLASLRAPLREPLRRLAQGVLPANGALGLMMIEARDRAELEGLLRDPAPEAGRVLSALNELWRANPQAWDMVRGVIAEVSHDDVAPGPEEALRRIEESFDRAVARSEEASVALYSLGNPRLLDEATAEVVALLRRLGALGPSSRLLDIGGGCGRFEAALAVEVGSIVGIDLSSGMVEAARRRCAAFGNVAFRVSAAHDLAPFAPASFDAALAIDVFPYIVQAGPDLVERQLAAVSRVLAPGGHLVILNYSYRADDERDRREVADRAGASGFEVRRLGTRDLALWDGITFHLVKPPAA
jgi:ubiquinone/menaquinone biosynthesis C-methylase UbiE